MQFAGYDHIDLRVADLASARAFYDILMPALGLTELVESPSSVEYYEPGQPGELRRFFGIHSEPGHRANDTRMCFTAASPSDVDRLALVVRAADARAIEGPEIPYSYEKYYAVFFEDASGNRLEIAFRRPHNANTAELDLAKAQTAASA